MLLRASCSRPPPAGRTPILSLRRCLTTHSNIKLLKEKARPGERLEVSGWVKTVRSQKSVMFLELNDGSCVSNVQVVAPPNPDLPIATGASVKVEGTWAESPGAKQAMELRADKLAVIGPAPVDYPLQKKHHTPEFLREIAHLRPRTNTFGAVLRMRDEAATGLRKFFKSEHFVEVNTPILGSSDCEGAGEQFHVITDTPAGEKQPQPDRFFGTPAYLTVSGQLQAEMFACALSRVYTLGPTFRAEDSNTKTHLAEFWMLEPEMAFADLNTVLDTSERMIKSTVSHLLEHSREDVQFFNTWVDKGLRARLDRTLAQPFVRISYTEAVDRLQRSGKSFVFPVKWGANLQKEHERWLCEEAFAGSPVFVTHYPKEIKPFYMKLNADGKTVDAVDLLVPGIGELIGGSAREEGYDALLQRIKDMKLNPETYQWYLDLRKYGTVPHGGFGMGFERFIQFVTGVENIRDVVPVPRHPGYCRF